MTLILASIITFAFGAVGGQIGYRLVRRGYSWPWSVAVIVSPMIVAWTGFFQYTPLAAASLLGMVAILLRVIASTPPSPPMTLPPVLLGGQALPVPLERPDGSTVTAVCKDCGCDVWIPTAVYEFANTLSVGGLLFVCPDHAPHRP